MTDDTFMKRRAAQLRKEKGEGIALSSSGEATEISAEAEMVRLRSLVGKDGEQFYSELLGEVEKTVAQGGRFPGDLLKGLIDLVAIKEARLKEGKSFVSAGRYAELKELQATLANQDRGYKNNRLFSEAVVAAQDMTDDQVVSHLMDNSFGDLKRRSYEAVAFFVHAYNHGMVRMKD